MRMTGARGKGGARERGKAREREELGRIILDTNFCVPCWRNSMMFTYSRMKKNQPNPCHSA